MRNLKTIKVYRYDEKECTWSFHEIKNVFITGTDQSYNLSDTLDKNVSCIMRVMNDLTCDVCVSDRVVIAPFDDAIPPDDALVVVSVRRNDHGANTHHTKILCR